MKLTVSAGKYMNEFMSWIDNNDYGHLIESLEIAGAGGFATFNLNRDTVQSITDLFETLILARAGMEKASEGLKNILKAAVFEPERKHMREVFENYILDNDHINLEGFAIFRLEEYYAMVNIVLYAAVKKMLY